MSKETGGPAFPVMDECEQYGQHYGLTIRDYTAIKAMQGLVAGSMADGSPWDVAVVGLIARASYDMADAMLAERAK